MYHKIHNTRSYFHFKQAHALCDSADMVFMEDLDYRISAKGMLGKHMLDAAFGEFRSIIKYVCWKRGVFFAEVDARGTSQECPECGAKARKDLSVRVHGCLECGYTTDRDVASGQVIRNRGITLISTPGLGGTETVCAVDLPGAELPQPRQVAKSPTGSQSPTAGNPPKSAVSPQGKNQKILIVRLGRPHCTRESQCGRMSLH